MLNQQDIISLESLNYYKENIEKGNDYMEKMEWLDFILAESLRQWNDFLEDRQDCTLEDFIEFTKEIANMCR
ncbi:MAG: hypothetical protein UIM53_05985 [Acutalibacteraceae bacterium]|nr:hypothetical protein [Acutalibacteraceae bacterium]